MCLMQPTENYFIGIIVRDFQKECFWGYIGFITSLNWDCKLNRSSTSPLIDWFLSLSLFATDFNGNSIGHCIHPIKQFLLLLHPHPVPDSEAVRCSHGQSLHLSHSSMFVAINYCSTSTFQVIGRLIDKPIKEWLSKSIPRVTSSWSSTEWLIGLRFGVRQNKLSPDVLADLTDLIYL